MGINSKTKEEVGVIIQDSKHKNVKARFWSSLPITNGFESELTTRINSAISKRLELNLLNERQNILLINGENDYLPGLFVLLFKDQILIQYYALFWKELESELIPLIKNAFVTYFPSIPLLNIWSQERSFDQNKSISCEDSKASADFVLEEFNVKYKIKINENYDYGIYTDMSSIRKQIKPYLARATSVLNLFCYSGAFSLYALSLGVKEVVSVDLSPKYLQWLEENLTLNSQLNVNFHQSIKSPTDKALSKFKAEQKKFEVIICDPPSASSDGDKVSNALKSYEQLLPLMLDVLETNGVIFAFLNTHQISWNKFEEKLKQIIATTSYKDEVLTGKRFKLSEDYLPIKGFYEGDYLKGILIEFKKKGKQ
jgi:23S rRNA (cytosine1962-C5)-methyltransferase